MPRRRRTGRVTIFHPLDAEDSAFINDMMRIYFEDDIMPYTDPDDDLEDLYGDWFQYVSKNVKKVAPRMKKKRLDPVEEIRDKWMEMWAREFVKHEL